MKKITIVLKSVDYGQRVIEERQMTKKEFLEYEGTDEAADDSDNYIVEVYEKNADGTFTEIYSGETMAEYPY